MVEGMPAVATNLQATKTDDVSACSVNALGRETRSGDIICRDETFVTAFLRLQEYIQQLCFPLHPKGRRGCYVRCPARPGTRPEAGRERELLLARAHFTSIIYGHILRYTLYIMSYTMLPCNSV
jgi:hypothetical protein